MVRQYRAGSSVLRIGEDGHKSRFLFDVGKQSYVPEEGGTARLTFNQKAGPIARAVKRLPVIIRRTVVLTDICDLDGHGVYFNYENGRLVALMMQRQTTHHLVFSQWLIAGCDNYQ